jgi:Zn finger protein HypA/HybF involved in hydrogenase expression
MREFALTQKLIDLALQKADSKRIVRVHLLIGPFSEQREESIAFYWKDLAKDSPGEGAELHFEHMPFQMKCLDCSGIFYLDEEASLCKYCFNERLQRLSGDDVSLESIEVE